MAGQGEKFRAYQRNSDEALIHLREKGLDFLDKSLIFQLLIYERGHFDVPTNVFIDELSVQEIITIVEDYYNQYGIPVAQIKIDTSDDFNFDSNSIIKGEYTLDNVIWTIHKTDVDQFPSNPHAHCYEGRVKLHLGTGEMFQKKNIVGKMKKKPFKRLQNDVEARLGKGVLDHLKPQKKK